jgi:hypothetical protein
VYSNKLKQNEILELKLKVFCKLKFSSHKMKKGRVPTHTYTYTNTHTRTHKPLCVRVHACVYSDREIQTEFGQVNGMVLTG